MIMAKAKKRVATRKKSSKRGKAGAKLGRKMAKHAKPKKAKSKVQRAGMSAKKRAAKKQRQAVETTKIDVIDEAAPGVISVKEYDSVRTATSVAPGIEPERGEAVGPAGASA
jgi:hypothetical protein